MKGANKYLGMDAGKSGPRRLRLLPGVGNWRLDGVRLDQAVLTVGDIESRFELLVSYHINSRYRKMLKCVFILGKSFFAVLITMAWTEFK